jgi:hypothetical protein
MSAFYYWSKDNVCHNSTIYHNTFYVDNSKPYVEITYPDHGYWDDEDKEYLKCYTNITLNAYDMPENECMAGIEGIFWRYTWDYGYYFPPLGQGGEGIVTGDQLADWYGYTDGDLIGYDWFYVDDDTVNISFPEECVHEFYYWAKDNVCHNSTVYHKTFYVDNTPPNVTFDIEEPYCIYNEFEYKVTNETKIWINATDLPENECAAGVESIFWRYENETGEHPIEGDEGAINGTVLGTNYGYTDLDILNHWWYNITDNSVLVQFENECQHDLYYWAKDNICNRTEIFNKTFYVDMTPPPNVSEIKEIGEPHAKLEPSESGHDQWMVFPETPICFNLTDFHDLGCGPESPVKLWYRVWYLGVWSVWKEYTDCIFLTQGCVHYLEAYAEDCLGNKGVVDNETFWVCAPGVNTGPEITILEPDFGDAVCNETVVVKIEASDDTTPTDQLDIVVWIPGGRRDAPTLWYYPEYNESDGFFYVEIDIYNYQSGAYLTVMAIAIDQDNNVEFAEPTEFVVCSTTIWDQWLQYGWNKLELPFGICNDEVERVLACLNNSGVYSYDGIYHYDPDVYLFPHWGSYSPYLEDIYNTLWNITGGKQYWIHCTEVDGIRYFIGLPDLVIENPIDGETYGSLDEINGTVWSSDSEILKVELQIYYKNESSVKHYWNGTGWDISEEKFLCTITGDYHKQWSWYSSGVTWIPGEIFYVKAVATDEYGCHAGDVNSFEYEEP